MRRTCSSSAEVLLEDFAGELLDGFAFLPGGLAQGEETLLIGLDLAFIPRFSHGGYLRILLSDVTSGQSWRRAVATMIWSAGSRWNSPGSRVDSIAISGVSSST